jgi:hypothetical protein
VRSVTLGNRKYIASSLWAEPVSRFTAAQSHKDTANAFADGTRPLPPLWGANAFEAVFDLGADPLETASLLRDDPSAAEELRAALTAYRERCAAQGIAPRVATQFESAVDAEQLQNLESLGYL